MWMLEKKFQDREVKEWEIKKETGTLVGYGFQNSNPWAPKKTLPLESKCIYNACVYQKTWMNNGISGCAATYHV